MEDARSCHLTKGRAAISFFLMTESKADHDQPLAKPTVQLENDRVIVTEWRFPPGGHTGWHRHMHDYVVVPITTGELHIFDGKATVPAPLRAGVSYARQTGVEHDVINPNSFEFVFVEIELKAR
jgi:quercetin dioxygenase-like cupin family protein